MSPTKLGRCKPERSAKGCRKLRLIAEPDFFGNPFHRQVTARQNLLSLIQPQAKDKLVGGSPNVFLNARAKWKRLSCANLRQGHSTKRSYANSPECNRGQGFPGPPTGHRYLVCERRSPSFVGCQFQLLPEGQAFQRTADEPATHLPGAIGSCPRSIAQRHRQNTPWGALRQ